MKKGFMDWLRGGYLETCPGLTAEEYARDGYFEGCVKSDAKDQEFSLASTLMKQVRDGKEAFIRRELIGKKYHYFPGSGIRMNTSCENIHFQIELSKKEWSPIDALVSEGTFRNRNEVIEWLVKRCISVGVGLDTSIK
jgi:hypothetical protein